MTAISLNKVTVDLPIYDAHHRSFRRALLRAGVGGTILSHRKGYPMVRALDEVDLELREGDRLGLVGHNGAGKSTLLRILGGLREPTGGTARIRGTACSLLNTGSILDPEMSGYENIDHVSTLLGLPPRRLPDLRREILEFTELGDFMQMPVRTYSSGMAMRLAFALLTAQEPDILLLDEVLGAGDVHFLKHAAGRLADLHARAKILVLVSHDPDHIRQMCDRVAWLEHGRIREIGPAEQILNAYLASR